MMHMKNDTSVKRVISMGLLLLILMFTMAHVSSTDRHIIRLSDREMTSFKGMVEELSSARTIYIGERHDNPAHHKTQLDIIKALREKGEHLAIGLEMFRKDNQKILDEWVAGKITEDRFIPVFLENWGFGWDLYRDIFLYAREHRIPLVGLNVPHEITRKVGKTGFASLTDEEQRKLPPGITCELDQQYMDLLVRIFLYKKNTDRSFYYFCEAQVLWDQAMAWYLAEYRKDNPGKTVIVLSGSIHAWKYGIPKHEKRYISGEQRVIIPDLPVDPATINVNDADYLVIQG
jgi:uncharacterized iron-regulated protein